jgi:DNA-binding MarR family transcriptional regulator
VARNGFVSVLAVTRLETGARWRRSTQSERAGINLAPPQLWLFSRLAARTPTASSDLAAALGVPLARIAPLVADLAAAGLADNDAQILRLTPMGQACYDQLAAARREGLREYLAGYDPDEHPELRRVLDELAKDVVGAIPAAPVGERG